MKTLLAVLLITLAASAGAAGSQEANVNKVFDREKGSIYVLYARALEEQPGLAGKVVVQFNIEKTGEVSSCRVLSSTLNAPELEGKICTRIQKMQFGPQPAPIQLTKPVDFFPA